MCLFFFDERPLSDSRSSARGVLHPALYELHALVLMRPPTSTAAF